ncbi:MAG: tRNA (adenosine(37)-N6)-threonylcarbamoyltransferase complex dimerization subunit type 1 TsaB [Spirochaetaceae bacterium]|jgi:tRNA threonylcarbamoyladenosine biosynthesis protein TsaB|nr:tRNA (adenosine(37)-N6)-threonylcarbamoyltransferase complex dimerization subunit type 1 TsaB [Spirochaetaceae bacterium]
MNILAFDSATAILSIALSSEKGYFYFEADAGPRHSELLLEESRRLIEKAGLETASVSLFACMGGPGSFTGLRIAFAAAKGMALGLGKPFVSVPTLDCMALPHGHWPGAVLPVIDAKKNRFFAAVYREGKKAAPCVDGGIPELLSLLRSGEKVLVTGPDAGLFMERLMSCPDKDDFLFVVDKDCRAGHAGHLLELAREKYILKNSSDDFGAGPFYLRKSDAELSLEEHGGQERQ